MDNLVDGYFIGLSIFRTNPTQQNVRRDAEEKSNRDCKSPMFHFKM